MRTTLGLILLALLLVVGSVRAQDKWQLRMPPAEEYVTVAPEVIEAWRTELPTIYGKVPNQPLVDAIAYELKNRYGRDVLFDQSFDSQTALYEALSEAVFMNNDPLGFSSDWAIALLKAWLRENANGFPQKYHIQTAAFDTTIQAADLNGDGENEYILDYTFSNLRNFLILQKDPTQREGYRVIEPPLSWEDFLTYYMSAIEYSDAAIEDINGDGLPEIEIIETRPSYYDLNWRCIEPHMLGWRDNTITELIEDYQMPCITSNIEYLNLDSDAALEIRYSYEDNNSWGCLNQLTQMLDWDGEHFKLQSEEKSVADSLNCALYQAERLMWDHKIADAIPLYEHGLEVGFDKSFTWGTEEELELTQYAQARLALAYALVGDETKSQNLLKQIQQTAPASEMMSSMIGAMSSAQPNAVALCTAAYNVFWDYQHSTFSYSLPSKIVIGRDEHVCCVGDNAPPEPEDAGCDAPRLIDEQLGLRAFTMDATPVEQLQQRNIEIESEFHGDFDGDGKAEWIVWPQAQVAPILFVPLGHTYYYSRPSVHRPSPNSQLKIIELPEKTGYALVDWIYLEDLQSEFQRYRHDLQTYWCAGQNGIVYNGGTIGLWRLSDLELKLTLEVPLCANRSIEDVFQANNQQLNAWSAQVIAAESRNNQYGAAVFNWDSVRQTYIPPAPLEIVATPVINIPLNAPYEVTLSPTILHEAAVFDVLREVNQDFVEEHFEAALETLDLALVTIAPDMIPLFTNSVHYFRGLALEALSRPDEALTEYVTIYEVAPESVWGKLARLHLECTRKCD